VGNIYFPAFCAILLKRFYRFCYNPNIITRTTERLEKRRYGMDPISIIVMALVGGAAAALLKPTTEQAIKDAYAGIKELIHHKFGRIDIAVLETDPASKARRAVIQEDLEKAGAGQDKELLRKAKALLDAIRTHTPDVPKAVGIDLEDIKGASLAAERILAEGSHATGVKVKDVDIQGDISFNEASASGKYDPPPGEPPDIPLPPKQGKI
jgi:hypothetical protein